MAPNQNQGRACRPGLLFHYSLDELRAVGLNLQEAYITTKQTRLQLFESIKYESRIPDHRYIQNCDGRLISQALINLTQNAADAIETRRETERDHEGKIRITLGQGAFDGDWRNTALETKAYIMVEDNGFGIPNHLKDKLTEPYVTTRAKGTGLGLAIVKKIMEDHGGDLIISDADPSSGYHGARIVLSFSGKE